MSGGNKFQARLDSQKAQLERNGYSAEVVVRTTPEATDMINFARLWEHLLITADRRTRGYMSADKRADYEKTQKAFLESIDFMMKNLKEEVVRHDLDLSGNNFISRVAQRYNVAEPRKGKASTKKEGSAKKTEGTKKPAEKQAQPPKNDAPKPSSEENKNSTPNNEVEGL